MSKIALFVIIIFALSACEFEAKQPWYQHKIAQKYKQVDRIGLPHLDEIFYGEGVLLEIRAGSPETDVKKLAPLIEESIANTRSTVEGISGFPPLRAEALTPAEIAELWAPNVIYIDIREPVLLEDFNGRPFEGEDSFDYIVSVALGRFLEDQIAVINRGLSSRFPYLAPPRKITSKEDPAGAEETPTEDGS